jgi:ATP-binding cassette subfamily C protein LapB
MRSLKLADLDNAAAVDPRLDEAVDPLLGCLKKIAKHHNSPASSDSLIAGLPLVEGRLTPALFERAAGRLGFSTRIVERPLSELHQMILPAVLLLKDGRAIILWGRRGIRHAQADVYVPEMDNTVSVTANQLAGIYSGTAILVKPEYALDARGSEAAAPERQRHWFWGTIFDLWPTYLQVMAAAAFVNILALASPLFIMNVYDRVLPNKAIETLWVLAVGMGIAILFDFILRMLRGGLIDSAGRRADVLLASRIFEHVMNMDLSCRPQTTGAFASQLREFEVVREFFTSSTLATITDFMFLGLFLFVIHQIGGPIVWVPLIAVLVSVTIGVIIQFPLNRSVRETQAESSHRHSLLVESIGALETIKILKAEGHLQRQWERFVGRTARTSEKVRFLNAIGVNITTLAQQLVTIGIVIVGVYLFESGEVSMGAIIACVILGGRAVSPLGQIATTIARCQQSFIALGSLNKIMAMPVERPAGRAHLDRRVEHGKVEFKAVNFTYPGAQKQALRDFSFKCEPGERLGIVGKIGSGKTTIGRLLTRLYLPSEGEVLLDGVDIRQYHPYEIRRSISLVGQDADLFYGTVRDNIVLGSPEVDDATLLHAVKLSGVEDFVAQHPLGLDMPVGERGTLLSGGQRQAIALARAFLFEPRMFFLDEPSSSMDLQTERSFIQRLGQAIQPHQCLIVATHRNSMLALVNRLVVLDNGKIIADGPKDAVLQALVKKQGSKT